MGGIPGIVPGQIAFGHSSAFAGAPSITGGIFSMDSSSFGNLKPASLNALPKSLSLGKSMWQVLQLVPYWREKAGMPKLGCAAITIRINNIEQRRQLSRKSGFTCIFPFRGLPKLGQVKSCVAHM